MLISIITPNRNGAKYIDRTLTSVLNQRGCEFELIVVDGASIDESLSIINRYNSRIACVISESDNGMYDAINKGISMARGEIIAYLNSDDFYYPGTLNFVSKYFDKYPEVDFIYGDLDFVDADEKVLFRQLYPSFSLRRLKVMSYSVIGQPAAFWRKSLQTKIGKFDISMQMASDFDFFIRAGMVSKLVHVSETLAAFRVHNDSLTSKQYQLNRNEVLKLHLKFIDRPNSYQIGILRFYYDILFKMLNWNAILFRLLNRVVKR